jgi:ion channel-forming bestrophin family protein
MELHLIFPDRTRDLVRMANAYYDARGVSPEQRADDLNHVALCTWAFVRAMKRHLSPPEEDETAFQVELYEKLPKQQAEMIIAAAHRPNRALQDLSYAVDDLPMHFIRKNEIHHSITQFEDNLGSSERILTSPVPLFYSRHLARFLATWMFLLPFGLYDAFAASWNHTGMIPAMTVVAVMLFGIEEIGTQLEEPFTVLPMQSFCDKIFNWCMEISSWSPGDNGRSLKPTAPQHAYFLNGGAASSSPSSSYQQESRPMVAAGGYQAEMAPAPAVNGSFEDFLRAQGQGY